MADQLLLYVKAILPNIKAGGKDHMKGSQLTQLELDIIKQRSEWLATDLRGEIIVSSTSPKTLAALVVYVSAITGGVYISYLEAASAAGIQIPTLSRNLKKYMNMLESRFNLKP